MTLTFFIMGIGMITTGIISYHISSSPELIKELVFSYDYEVSGRTYIGYVYSNFWITCMLIEIALSILIYYTKNALPTIIVIPSFFIYSVLNGITISPLISLYTGESVAVAFFISALLFAITAAYSLITKKTMSSKNDYIFIGAISLILSYIIHSFIGSSNAGFLISAVVILMFIALTIYDINTLRDSYYANYDTNKLKAATSGALILYVNFMFLFVRILGATGKRRNS